jgi:hypothetical protein
MERSKYAAQNKRWSNARGWNLGRNEILTKCKPASSKNEPGKHSEIKVVVLNNQANSLISFISCTWFAIIYIHQHIHTIKL